MKDPINNPCSLLRSFASKFIAIVLMMLLPTIGLAQKAVEKVEYNSLSLFGNTLFNVLLGVIVFLLIIIIILSSVLKNVARYILKKLKENKNTVGLIVFLISMLSGSSAFAQRLSVSTPSENNYMGLSPGLFFWMIAFIVVEVVIIIALFNYIQYLLKQENKSVPVIKKQEPSLLEKLNASVAIEKEEEIMFDHEYDGIRELDNDLPPWWKYGFYVTIVFAVFYLIRYHFISADGLQTNEYNRSMIVAKVQKEEYEKNNAENVNESNAVMLTDKAELEKGKVVFEGNCVACHGKLGEGGVGPNLTDDYWLHGGSIKDIFKTIKYGWPDKGMKAWQADLTALQIHEITCYIKTLHGTNPPNAKEKQGDLFQEQAIAADSANVKSVVDSVGLKK